MKTIIIDDEPKAIDLIKSYLLHFDSIELVASFRNALKAFEFMNKEQVDLVFLDINMPHLSGIALSKMIKPGIKIVFTTAYSEYALESYEVEASDYLLKPISLERFTKAISRILANQVAETKVDSNMLLIKSGSTMFRIDPEEILFLEKEGNYLIYHTTRQKIMARESVSRALQKLPASFIQVHKSFIVNLNRIDFIDKNDISIDKRLIPIGQTYKRDLTSLYTK